MSVDTVTTVNTSNEPAWYHVAWTARDINCPNLICAHVFCTEQDAVCKARESIMKSFSENDVITYDGPYASSCSQ